MLKFACLCLILGVTAFSTPAPSSQRTPSREARIPGFLDVSPTARNETITAPATVRAGESFQMTVTTSGGGCEQAGDTSVIMGESEANVMVYDVTVATRPNVACTMIYKRFSHTATLRFSKPGEAVVRVWGRTVGSETGSFGAPAIIEHRLKVQ